jgi:hypothetical protein
MPHFVSDLLYLLNLIQIRLILDMIIYIDAPFCHLHHSEAPDEAVAASPSYPGLAGLLEVWWSGFSGQLRSLTSEAGHHP